MHCVGSSMRCVGMGEFASEWSGIILCGPGAKLWGTQPCTDMTCPLYLVRELRHVGLENKKLCMFTVVPC